MTYEEAEKELEQIIEKVENGNLKLEESTKLLERGAELIEFCSKQLDDTKGKITVIRQKMENIFEEDLK